MNSLPAGRTLSTTGLPFLGLVCILAASIVTNTPPFFVGDTCAWSGILITVTKPKRFVVISVPIGKGGPPASDGSMAPNTNGKRLCLDSII